MISSQNSTSPAPFDLEQHQLGEINRYIYAILFPIIFLLGLIGNLLSSLIFSITKLNLSSCGVYFLQLAIYDSIALICGLHHCLTIGYHVQTPGAWYCQIRNFATYLSMDMASWMIVAISVDRLFKVKLPMKSRVYVTRKSALIVSGVVTLLFLGKNFHLLTNFIGDFTDLAVDNCDPNPNYPRYVFFFKNVWPWIDLTTYALVPFVIVALANAFIIHDHYQRRLRLRKHNLDLSLIGLLLISSISLFVCHLPITVLAGMYPYISSSYDDNEIYDRVAFAFDILRLPSYASLALNFYFYYYNSSLFRHQTVLVFRRVCRRQAVIDKTNRASHAMNRMASIDASDVPPRTSWPVIEPVNLISRVARPSVY